MMCCKKPLLMPYYHEHATRGVNNVPVVQEWMRCQRCKEIVGPYETPHPPPEPPLSRPVDPGHRKP